MPNADPLQGLPRPGTIFPKLTVEMGRANIPIESVGITRLASVPPATRVAVEAPRAFRAGIVRIPERRTGQIWQLQK